MILGIMQIFSIFFMIALLTKGAYEEAVQMFLISTVVFEAFDMLKQKRNTPK